MPSPELRNDVSKTQSMRSLEGSILTAEDPAETRPCDNTHRLGNSSKLLSDNGNYVNDAVILRSRRAENRTRSSSDESWHLAASTSFAVADQISMSILRPLGPPRSLTAPIPRPDLDPSLRTLHADVNSPQTGASSDQNIREDVEPSNSIPQLLAAPAHASEVINEQGSFHSIQKQRIRGSLESASPTPKAPWRSFSFDDLQCISANSHRKENTRSYSENSTTSDLGRFISFFDEGFPRQPLDPPPDRVTTPPGLPSFGTHSALLYRLDTPKRRFQHPARSLTQPRHPRGEISHQSTTSLGPGNLPLTSQRTDQASTSADVMKHLLAISGISRIVRPLPQRSKSGRRVSLPTGVRRSNAPGALARAEDGTLIRGTFSNRASGHGLSRRDLESHPLSTRFLSIDEVVRQIEKACDQTYGINLQRPEQNTTETNQEMDQQQNWRWTEEPQTIGEQAGRAEISVALRPENSSTESRHITIVNGIPELNGQAKLMVSPPQQQSSAQNGPAHGYRRTKQAPEPESHRILQQPSVLRQANMAALQNWVEEGERVQDRERIKTSRKKKQSWLCRLWRWIFSSFHGSQLQVDNV